MSLYVQQSKELIAEQEGWTGGYPHRTGHPYLLCVVSLPLCREASRGSRP